MKSKSTFVIFLWIFEISSEWTRINFFVEAVATSKSNKETSSDEKIKENLFNPKMDYDEWTPLGRGDPLKNDPTYDYVPPVLERVHYWMEPNKRTPDPPLPNPGVLVFGSRAESTFATRPTTPRYKPFLPKDSQANSRIDTSSLLDPFLKLMDVPQFGLNFNSNLSKSTVHRLHRPTQQGNRHKISPPQALQRPPYTMLVPPPPPPPSSLTPSTTSSTMATFATVSDKSPFRPTMPANLQTLKNITTTDPSIFANTVNVFNPVAISMPGQTSVDLKEQRKEEKVMGEISPSTKSFVAENNSKHSISGILNNQKKLPDEPKLKQPQKIISNSNYLQSDSKNKPTRTAAFYSANKTRINVIGPQTKKPEDDFPDKTRTPLRVRPNHLQENILAATKAPFYTTTMPTTRIDTLTTDPLFKHYEQSSDTVRGPFYLIIQGHSKVKTYGASKNPINAVISFNEIKREKEERVLEKKSKKLKFDVSNKILENNIVEVAENEKESLEEAFPPSVAGRSTKRNLVKHLRRKRFALEDRSPRGLPKNADCDKEEEFPYKTRPEDFESLLAVGDDYDPGDVADILLGPQGSGLGSPSAFGKFWKEIQP